MPSPERALIKTVRRLAHTRPNQSVIKGIGDDTAVLRSKPGNDFLVTTDLCIENVHFRREWHPADCVGHRCLARGLSDIAAMGGEPMACFLSLGLPDKLPQRWVNAFVRGLIALATRYGVELAGGDISGAPAIVADIIVTGQMPSGKAIRRAGARPGDRIFVTGTLGDSAATLQRFFAGEKVRPSRNDRHFYPEPRVAVGRWLSKRSLATSMIDLSDGLSVDLSHICDESRVSAVIEAARIPVAQRASLELALHGGEDYELLFTAPGGSRLPQTIEGVKVTQIGTIGDSHAHGRIRVLGEDGNFRSLKPRGWQHLNNKRS